MRNLLNPKWLLLINTLPMLVLFFLFSGEYNIIKSLLKPENFEIWKQFSIAFVIMILLALGYALYATIRKTEISLWYAIAVFFTFLPFVYLNFVCADEMIPWDVPRWMVPMELSLYVLSFTMPTLVHAIIVAVLHLTSERKKNNALLNFGAAAVIPFGGYVGAQVLLPLFKNVEDDFNIHVILIFIISGTILFLFFLIRTAYILALKKSAHWKKNALLWKIPLSILFPVLGLVINNGSFLTNYFKFDSGIFGDFSSIWFFILVIGNGIMLCLSVPKNKYFNLALFVGKSITFTCTLYFFMVFLPFLPLSILAVIAVGIGFLMLSPLLLFVIHVKSLADDFRQLSVLFPKRQLLMLQLSAMLVLPLALTCNNYYHKIMLNKTLDYVYNPNYSRDYNIDKSSVEKTFSIVKVQKERGGFMSNIQTPYLSTFFNWIVLDNMTLSDKKIDDIERIFVSDHKRAFENATYPKDPVATMDVTIANVTSEFNAIENAWKSTVDLNIMNNSDSFNSMFETSFELPAGCWISDYYLFIGDRKEKGLLAEKKAAQWIFSQIVNENRDPGILYYENSNRVAFKVFPFVKDETRKTGIEFVHKEPLDITIAGNKIHLGDEKAENITSKTNSENADYVSILEKNKLEKIQRTPYYCFIADVSANNEKLQQQYVQQIEAMLNSGLISSNNAELCLTNTYAKSEKIKEGWEMRLDQQVYEGGFYLERALKKVLFENYARKSRNYPVFIVLTDRLENSVIGNSLSDFSMTFPESELFYTLDASNNLVAHSMIKNPMEVVDVPFDPLKKVFAYPNGKNPMAFLPDNGKAEIVLKSPILKPQTEKHSGKWASGLQLHALWMSQVLYPEKTADHWTEAVRLSFSSGIMSAQTSYIAVENEAQKAMLLKKQQQVLSGNKSLDLQEDQDAQKMSEPGLVFMALLLFLVLLLKPYASKFKHALTK